MLDCICIGGRAGCTIVYPLPFRLSPSMAPSPKRIIILLFLPDARLLLPHPSIHLSIHPLLLGSRNYSHSTKINFYPKFKVIESGKGVIPHLLAFVLPVTAHRGRLDSITNSKLQRRESLLFHLDWITLGYA
jgi:hypothetical protein